MRLTILFDHRYVRLPDGRVGSKTHYNYDLFAGRYLHAFDQVDVITRTPEPAGTRVSLGPGVDLVSVGTWEGTFDFLRKASKLKRFVRRELKQAEVALLIVPSFLSILAGKKLRRLKLPYGVEVVGDPDGVFSREGSSHPLRSLLRVVFKRELTKLCATAATGAYVTRDALQAKYPVADGCFSTHYSSIQLDEAAIAAQPRTFAATDAPRRLVCVAAMLHRFKGQHLLLKAIAKCRDRGRPLRLELVGDGPLRGDLERQCAELGLSDLVTFHGRAAAGAEVRERLDAADIAVLFSLTEGLPRVVIESMARGLPCVASEVGGVPELLPPEFRVPASDVDALADRLFTLAGDPAAMTAAAAANLVHVDDYRADRLMERRHAHYAALREAATASVPFAPPSNIAPSIERRKAS